MSEPWMWYLSRAAGVVTLVMFTGVVVLGVLTARPLRLRSSNPVLIVAIHRSLALGSLIFLTIHVSTAVADSYVDISWPAVFLPFASGYSPIGVAFGTLALDVVAAIIVTSLLRHRIPERWWRTVHWGAYAMAAFAAVHALVMASSDQPVLLGISIGCVVVMAAATAWRLVSVDHDARRRALVAAGEWS